MFRRRVRLTEDEKADIMRELRSDFRRFVEGLICGVEDNCRSRIVRMDAALRSIEGEDFIDSVVDRINRKQIGGPQCGEMKS